jgi:hypothetical protein
MQKRCKILKNKKMMQFEHFSVDLSTKQQLLRMQHAFSMIISGFSLQGCAYPGT